MIPYTLDANDFKFLIPNGFVTADDFTATWPTRSSSSTGRADG